MNKNKIQDFLVEKRGYLKKNALEVAKALWKQDSKFISKSKEELKKDLIQIKEVQQALRKASVIEVSLHEQKLIDIYHEIIKERNKPKRVLFFDIETSPNLVFSWNIGRKISLTHDNIINERAIICISYKWGHEDVVHSLSWNKGDDSKMLKQFSEIMNSADIVIGHNSDNFDIKWIRTRCLFYGIELKCKFNAIDTLKLSRQGFKFNSNRLDYISKFLGNTGKKATGYDLWKSIVLENNKQAMNTMVDYCENDVLILEDVYTKLQKFVPEKKFKFN